MKTRTITGVIFFIFLLPFIIFNEYVSAIYVALFLIFGIYELLSIKKKASQNPIPIYVYAIAIIFGLLMIFDIPGLSNYAFNYQEGYLPMYGIFYLWPISYLLVLLVCSIFDEKLSIIDSLYSFGTVFYLALCLKGMLYIKSLMFTTNSMYGMLALIFAIIVSFATDIFAYFGGMGLRRVISEDKLHKLNPRVSPKKTIEGAVIGTVVASILGFVFAYYLLELSLVKSIVLPLCLSIFSQIGDLVFSLIKRYFGVKDYSNLLPGHGGLLDRIDSLLLVCLVFSIFMSLI